MISSKNFERAHSVATESDKKKETRAGGCGQCQSNCDGFSNLKKNIRYFTNIDITNIFPKNIRYFSDEFIFSFIGNNDEASF